MVAGLSPGVASHGGGREPRPSTGYRWWRALCADRGLGTGLQERPSTPQAPAPASRRGRGGGDPHAARTRSGERGPSCSGRCWRRIPPRPWARCCRRLGHSRRPRAPRPPVLRYAARPPRGVAAPRHQEARPLLASSRKRITRDGIQRSPRAGWPQHVHRGCRRPLAAGLRAEVRHPVTARAMPWPSWTGRWRGSARRGSRCRP